MKIKEIMKQQVISVSKEQSIEEVAKVLADNGISGVPVVDDAGKVIGVISETDLLCKDIEPRFPSYIELLGGIIYIEGIKKYEEELRKLTALTAEQIMTKAVVTAKETDDIRYAATLMVDNKVNRLPVVNDQNKLVGIISRSDLVKTMIK